MELFELFVTFFKIGLFNLGGGYAMIPFFEREIALHQWTEASDYHNVVAVAQVIPGPFAVDSSTYIGYKVAGLLGALTATVGLTLASFIIMALISKFYVQFKANGYISLALKGVRPIVVGILMSAAYIIGIEPMIQIDLNLLLIFVSFFLILLGYVILKYTKINVFFYIAIFGLLGFFVF
ncbi:MAG: chromate transporter [Clostridia bacterium]|nr:chromate transporter [Clostridia bacterium]